MTSDIQGKFEVIESFGIASRNEFYMIGQLKEGEIFENWFVRIHLNSSLKLTLRIKAVEEIALASDGSKYKLIIIDTQEHDSQDFLLALGVGSEMVEIGIEGED